MVKQKLALFGGEPARKKPFPKWPYIGKEERELVNKVLDSGNLSTFVAADNERFYGGEMIKEFEKRFADYHGVKHAVAMHSATDALHAAVVACGVEPGEQIIVPPTTFTSTATCALMHNAVPVFADIDEKTYCINHESVLERITKKTAAMIPVHLFGHAADMDKIMEIASSRDIKVIEDCAQAIGARYKGKLLGTIGDCGIFSFQESKFVATGEGGMLITDDDEIAYTAKLVRNHGEVLPKSGRRTYKSKILGWNYRMTEFEAALGIAQFSRLDVHNKKRRELADLLTKSLAGINGITPPYVAGDCEHVYWVYGIFYEKEKVGIERELFVKALDAEGIRFFGNGYVEPLYWNPLYNDNDDQPFALRHFANDINYERGICPVAEKLHLENLMNSGSINPLMTEEDVMDIANGIRKVYGNVHELKRIAS